MHFAPTLVYVGLSAVSAVADYVPTIENNFDFVGNNIANLTAGNADLCIGLCQSNAQCHAFTWSDANGGTCWLKSGRDTVVFKRGVKSAVLTKQSMQPCEIQEGLDYAGHDIANIHGDSVQDCCALCQQHEGCRVYSWTNYNGGTCWLKNQLGYSVQQFGAASKVASGVAYPSNLPSFVLMPKNDYVGHDIDHKPANKPELCGDICFSTPGCHVFSWSNYEGGMCWLKASHYETRDDNAVTGGIITKPYASALFYYDADIAGHDLQSHEVVVDPNDCIQICADTKDCKAVSWNNYHGGTCWLKTSTVYAFNAPNVQTFVLTSGAFIGWD